MKKTENKRNKVQMPAGIRQKMMAAVSMLMVSCIMLVSSTYAWFTLSTAPEVTGITTNVGSNGNLEMMLLTGSYDATAEKQVGSYYSTDDNLGVESQIGDSIAATQDATESNITWGNLVDLSDGSYGLRNVVLSPARLNLTTKDTIVGDTLLMAPSYGADGRVVDVKTATFAGKAEGNTFAYDLDHKGVRVLGTTTDVSQRVASYRAAKSAISTYKSSAKSAATTSLRANGQDLADILVGYVSNPDATYTYEDLRALNNVLTSLQSANDSIAASIKNTVIAYSLSDAGKSELTDKQVTDLVKAIEAVTIESGKSFSSIENVTVPNTGLSDAIDTYLKINRNIADAKKTLLNNTKVTEEMLADKTNYPDTAGKFTYDEIKDALNYIVDRKFVIVADVKDPTRDSLGTIVGNFISSGSVVIIEMEDGSGVYADIAVLTGDYTASGINVFINYPAMNFARDVPLEMKTIVEDNSETNNAPQIDKISIGNKPEDSGQSENSELTNTYGYALDFGFRTNAAVSDLLLQTDAVNRVYGKEDGQETLNTQGSGSYMEFTSNDISTFTSNDVLGLMSAIRVAFITPTSDGEEVLAIAAMNIVGEIDQTTGLTTYKENKVFGEDVTTVSEIKEGDVVTGYKAELYLYDYKLDGAKLILNDIKKETTENTEETGTYSSVITALTQNVASKITVVVYLDGDIIDNTMVANAETSITGNLNLQFSSSATLKPMENAKMKTEGGSTGTALTYDAIAGTGTNVTTYTFAEGYTGTVIDGYTIYKGSNEVIYYKHTSESVYTKMDITNFSTAVKIEQSTE